MVSRLPSSLHPVAGRPLVWHTVHSLRASPIAPADVVAIVPSEVTSELFEGAGIEVRTLSLDTIEELPLESLELGTARILLVHASATFDGESIRRLVEAAPGSWIGGADGFAAAVSVTAEDLDRMIRQSEPFSVSSGIIDPERQLRDTPGAFIVRNRTGLARVQQRIRDALVHALMDAGATFILPETVAVDVDVRIGRDTVIYPGVVIEGQTTIGEETVIGPGCRIIDSWVGSGVELKGWNYVAHTSVRNRAILEPYVRRGFN